MFQSCSNLTSLNVSNFNTQNVTDMCFMFKGCSNLTSLDVSNFNTQNVTNMEAMFASCINLTSLDVSNFNTKNVTDMYGMFWRCDNLTSLDISNFDTQNVTDMRKMFEDCRTLATIYASDKFVTTACSEDEEMFGYCEKLVGAVPYDPNRVGKEMANYTTGYFTYKAASGIDAVPATDNIAAEYYDVNGRRLNAPQKGINIVKRGNITTKVLVK
jgi:surface protein